MSNPCTDKLSDLEYLEHMIPHHQVAIDMSNSLINSGKLMNPVIATLCRNIIFTQGYEVWEMNILKKRFPNSTSSDDKPTIDVYNDITK